MTSNTRKQLPSEPAANVGHVVSSHANLEFKLGSVIRIILVFKAKNVY